MTGLYIHVPFCVRKCPYCDFYSEKFSRADSEKYAAAVVRNLKRYPVNFDTVYFGGGTPALISGKIAEILREVEFPENAEITVECNPDIVNERVLTELKNAGVNRLSFGVQSLNESELAALGRLHGAESAKKAIILARELGFENISADLMLGVPQQSVNSLEQTIDELCALPITHVSAYLLKIEPNTPFGKNPPEIPDEDEQAELYLAAVENLEKRGFRQYEISNFAKVGFESRHNLIYWRAEEYVGIGPAAHSYYNGKRFAVPRNTARFLESDVQREVVTDENPDKYEEKVMLGLRLREGVSLDERLEKRLRLIPREYFVVENGKVSLTPKGFLVSNMIIATLLG